MKIIHINRIIDFIKEKSKKDNEVQKYANDNKTEINTEIDFLSSNRSAVNEILSRLFGDNIPTSPDFYKTVHDLEYFIGFGEDSYKLGAYLIIETYNQLSENSDAEDFLYLLSNKDVDIWTILPALPIILTEINLSAETVYKLFNSINATVENDLASGNFYVAIQEYAYNFYESAIQLVKLYFESHYNSHIVSIILGAIRARLKKENINCPEFEELDTYFDHSSNIKFKKAYNNSWVILCWRNLLNIDELNNRLSIITQSKNEEEIEDAFNLICKCVIHNRKNKDFVEFGIKWIESNFSICNSEQSKYSIISLMTHLCDYHRSERIVDIDRCIDLIINIQPIADTSGGTWRDLEHYLVRRLEEDKELFENFLCKLIQANYEGLLLKFRDGFDYLSSQMNKYNFSNFVIKLLFSKNQKERKIGRLLFSELNVTSLEEVDFKQFRDVQFRFAILESIVSPFLAEETERFFRLLEPAFRKVNAELKNLFIQEMIFQAINYPGTCLDNWKKIKNKSAILKQVIKEAEDYFNKLKEVQYLPAKSFTSSSFFDAAIRGGRKFSNNIRQGAHEKSVFMNLVKITHLIYGKKSSYFINGNLSAQNSMGEFSHSLEFARMEEIDAEGMKLKRIQTGIELNNLQKEITDQNGL